MTRHYEDRFAELQELTFRAQHDPEYLTRLREREGVSFSPEAECASSESPVSDSSDMASQRLESDYPSCCGPAIPVSPPPTTPISAPSGTGRWQRMLKRFGKLVLP